MEAVTTEPSESESIKPCDQNNRLEAESNVPHLQSSPFLDASESLSQAQVNLEPSLRTLPNCTTRGISKASYEPTLSYVSKYPINNYVSYHRLSKTCESFANQLFAVQIPNSVQQAMK